MRSRVVHLEKTPLEEKRELAQKRRIEKKRQREKSPEEFVEMTENELCEVILTLFKTKEKLTTLEVIYQTSGQPKRAITNALKKLATRSGKYWKLKDDIKLFVVYSFQKH
jgi:hypothetical protein